MSVAAVRRVVSQLEQGPPTDAELVRAIAPNSANREDAFAELVNRYGSMVLGVCRGVLSHTHTAEDAFQAVFLVLARRSQTIQPPGAVAGWLYGVAVRTAQKAKTAAARRQRREMAAIVSATSQTTNDQAANRVDRDELRAIIDTELAALPESHRAAVVLCDLQGKTRAEAAAELNRAEGTVAAWLSRGRKALAARLARRGVTLPVALATVLTPAVVSAELASASLGLFAGRAASPAILSLAENVMRSLSAVSAKLVAGVFAVGAILAAMTTALAWPTNSAHSDTNTPPVAVAQPPASETKPEPQANGIAEHKGHFHLVAYSPNGKQFLTASNGQVTVWDANTTKPLYTRDAEFARFSDDGKKLFYLTKDRFHHADATTGTSQTNFMRTIPKTVIGGRYTTISGDGSSFVECDGVSQQLQVYPVPGACPTFADQVTELAFSQSVPDYGRVGEFEPGGILRFAGIHRATTDYKERACLSVWKLHEGKRIGTIAQKNNGVQAFTWSPDGKQLLVAFAYDAAIYDAATLKEVQKIEVAHGSAVAWAPDGKQIAIAVSEKEYVGFWGVNSRVITKPKVVLVTPATGKATREIAGFAENLPIVSIAFAPNGKQLLSAAGFLPNDSAASFALMPKPANDAKGFRIIPLSEPAKPNAKEKPVWKQKPAIELTDFYGGSLAYSPDGKTLLVAGSGSQVRALDIATQKELWKYAADNALTILSLNGDGKQLAVTWQNGVRILDAATGKIEQTIEHKDADPLAVAWFTDTIILGGAAEPALTNHKLIYGHARGYTVKTWKKPELLSTISLTTMPGGRKPADEYAVPLAVSPDGKGAVTTGPLDRDAKRNVLWVWNAGSGASNELLDGHTTTVVSAAWSKRDNTVVTGDANGVVIVWDTKTWKEKSRVKLPGRVAGIAISHDAKHIAAAVTHNAFEMDELAYREAVFAWATDSPPKEPKPLSETDQSGVFRGVAAVAFAPDGKSFAATFCNLNFVKIKGPIGKVQLFAIPEDTPAPAQKWTDAAVLLEHKSLVNGVAWAPDGKSFAAATGAGVHCWDTTKREELWSSAKVGPTSSLAYRPDGKFLAVAAQEHPYQFDAVAGNGKIVPWEKNERLDFADPRAVLYSPDGKYLAIGNRNVVQLHSPTGGKGLFSYKVRDVPAKFDPKIVEAADVAIAWNPKSNAFAMPMQLQSSGLWRIKVQPLTDTAKAHSLAGHDHEPTAVAWSPDGKRIVSGDSNGVVIAHDAATGKQLWKKTFHGRDEDIGRINGIAISPADGTIAVAMSLMSGKAAERVRLLAPETGEEVANLARLWTVPVVAVAWSPDGKFLLTGCGAYPGFVLPPGEVKHVGEVVVWERKP